MPIQFDVKGGLGTKKALFKNVLDREKSTNSESILAKRTTKELFIDFNQLCQETDGTAETLEANIIYNERHIDSPGTKVLKLDNTKHQK